MGRTKHSKQTTSPQKTQKKEQNKQTDKQNKKNVTQSVTPYAARATTTLTQG
jgi:hypothetical protein